MIHILNLHMFANDALSLSTSVTSLFHNATQNTNGGRAWVYDTALPSEHRDNEVILYCLLDLQSNSRNGKFVVSSVPITYHRHFWRELQKKIIFLPIIITHNTNTYLMFFQ